MFFRKAKPAGPIDFIIVGLGNPGSQYEGTRHNAGFMALDVLAGRLGAKVTRVRFRSLCAEAELDGRRVLLLKPQTYMNNSGEAVREAMRFYRIPPEQVLVLLDDITLPVGGVRVRRKGSDAGQRGMRSIIGLSGSDQFPRVKIGVGEKPHPDYDLAKWVLSRFTEEERPRLAEAVSTAADAAALIAQDRVDEAMNRYSRRA